MKQHKYHENNTKVRFTGFVSQGVFFFSHFILRERIVDLCFTLY